MAKQPITVHDQILLLQSRNLTFRNVGVNNIDLTEETLSAFLVDGKAYRELTLEMIDRVITGHLIITEFHQMALGNVVYIDACSELN